MRQLSILAAAAATLVVAAPAAANPRVPSPPMAFPGDASASAVRADAGTWLVGASPSAATAQVAARFGARQVVEGSYVVARAKARAFGRALGTRLTYAEPNRLSSFHQTPRAVADDPLSAQVPWRDAAVDPALAPPAVLPNSPVLALVDAKADTSHPEFASGNLVDLPGQSVTIDHGTATAAVASAPVNGIGMVGVWPGMRAINVPLPGESISCSQSAVGIRKAIAAGAAVINMSYGSSDFCQTEYNALQEATRAGITLVAAAGNEFDQGNPLEFPASLPHVLTIAAFGSDLKPAFFSNENAAVDLAAPGVGIVTAAPVALDTEDGTQDGYEIVSGTSFAAPMVAAAAAWVRQVRPQLKVDQVAQVIRLSAADIGDAGYDAATGFGRLNLGGALVRTPPVADRQEPNEDIGFVDGRAFGKAASAIFKGHGSTSFKALLDAFEDPDDVYRVRLPGRGRLQVKIKPSFGNPDLELYSTTAKTIGTKRGRLKRSLHTGKHTDSISFRNPSRRARTFYVRVWIRSGQKTLDAGYTLSAKR